MKRTRVEIEDIVDFSNLAVAVYLASKCKKNRHFVRDFLEDFHGSVNRFRMGVLNLKAPYGKYHSFVIRDPKRRLIHVACFEDRIIHHALIRHIGPVLDRVLVQTTYACRLKKGNVAAIERVQHGLQRFSWFVKLDIHHFFCVY